MLHLTLQTLLDLSKYTQKQNNWPNKDVENQKYEGCYPVVTHKLLFHYLPYLGPVSPDTDPTKIYIHPSLSLMLPLNIDLPKTPHGLPIDRCHEPCPSVIPNTDQPRLQPIPPSPDPVLPQCWPSQDYCFLVSVMGWSQSSFTRWQAPPIPALVGVSSNGIAFGLFWKLLGVSGL